MDLPDGTVGTEFVCNAGDKGLIPGLGRSPGEGNGNPFQSSCLENSMDRGTWQVTVRGVTKNETRLNDRAHMWGLKLLQVISSSLTRDYLVP